MEKTWPSALKIRNSWKALTSGSANRKIFGAAVTIALLTGLVKLAIVFRELVVAWRFGTSEALDAFVIALLVPTFLINSVANSFNAALIPTYISVREEHGEKAAQRLFSGVMVWSLVLLIVVAVLMITAAPLYLRLLATGFSQEKLGLTFKLVCILTPVVLLRGVAVIWGAVLNAGERFALAAVSQVITPVVSVLLLLATSWGVYALAIGLVCGAFLEMVLLGVALKRENVQLRPRWYGFDAPLRQVASQYAPKIAAVSLRSGTILVDQAMAAMLVAGSVVALNYGSMVTIFILSISGTALSTAVIPYFSKMTAQQDWQGLRQTLRRYLLLIFLATVPLTAFIYIFSPIITRILFERGSFTSSDTHLVAQVQAFYALQIPFYVAGILLATLLSSLLSTRVLMWASALSLAANVVLNYLLMMRLGVAGIALSTSCVYLLSFAFLSYCCTQLLRQRTSTINALRHEERL
jgi:putative peptidoglycan lipid II flippase